MDGVLVTSRVVGDRRWAEKHAAKVSIVKRREVKGAMFQNTAYGYNEVIYLRKLSLTYPQFWVWQDEGLPRRKACEDDLWEAYCLQWYKSTYIRHLKICSY